MCNFFEIIRIIGYKELIFYNSGIIQQVVLFENFPQNYRDNPGRIYHFNIEIKKFHNITEELLTDIKNGLLGKPCQLILKNGHFENLINIMGLFFACLNYNYFIKNLDEIPDYYNSNVFKIDRDLSVWKSQNSFNNKHEMQRLYSEFNKLKETV